MLRFASTAIFVAAILLPAAHAQDAKKKTPSLVVDISAAAIDAAVRRSVDRTEDVDEIIQDSPVYGKSRIVGGIAAELLPSPSHGAIDIVFRGQSNARTVSIRPFVFVHAFTQTPFEVRRRVMIDGTGLSIVPGPQFARSASMLLDVTSREEPDYLAMWVGRKLAERNKSLAEEEIACKVAAKLSRRLGDELTPKVESLARSAGDVLKQLKRAGADMDSLTFSSTPAHLQGRIHTPTTAKITPMPPWPGEIDVGVRVHHSFINETARKVYGGRTFPVTEASAFYEEATLGLLRDGRKDEDKKGGLKAIEKLIATFGGKGATITLADEDPLTVAFVEQGFAIEIHIGSIRQGDKTYAGTRVQATYAIENAKDGVHLVRKDAIRLNVDAPAGKLEAQPVAFRLLQNLLFGEILMERLILDATPPSVGEARFAAPRAGTRDGWLGVAWMLSR
jgi:hypothetical protein